MTKTPLVVIGDALLDRDVEGEVERLSPEAPVPVLDEMRRRTRPGGAALAAALAAADGRDVTLVTALADDPPGRELAQLLERAGVAVVDVGLEGETPTKVRFRTHGRLLLRVDRPAARASARRASEWAASAVEAGGAVLVSDYGRGLAADPRLRAALARMAPRRPVVWDPHPLGVEPVPGVAVATPNGGEATRLVPAVASETDHAMEERARVLLGRWRARAVVVTLGGEGAILVAGERPPVVVPTRPAADGDPCGAGDRFASALAARLADGAWLPDAVAAAVAEASAFVANGGAGAFALPAASPAVRRPGGETAEDVVERVRAAGGTVVAAGGCFDLLHAGHVSTLAAARRLGDCLIVCLNSDASVRRLKGPDRPLVNEDDRAAVLRALACVDAVVVFDEDTPERALERLRPDVFAKGGDYALDELPETRVLERWGGRAVILPYVEGRSTTRLLEEVAVRAGG